jgi:hypothetical protein
MDAFRQRGCHHVSPWAERYLPADVQRKWCAQKQLIYRADFSSPWLRSQKSCSFLRELYQRDKKLRALAALARMALKRDTTCGYEASPHYGDAFRSVQGPLLADTRWSKTPHSSPHPLSGRAAPDTDRRKHTDIEDASTSTP